MTMLTPFLLCCGAWLGAADVGAEGGALRFPFFEPVQPPRKVQVMAHRGAMRQAPENTAAALEFSIADGVEWVEVDVRLTRDGRHVLFHDGELGNKTNGGGRVRDHTLAEIRALDAGSKFARRFGGERVLSLGEGLELARGRVNLYLDCKEVDPALLAREVIGAKMERQVIIYDRPEVLRAVREASGGEVLALMTKWRPRFGITPWVDEVRPAAVEIDAVDVTPEACREFHRRGIKVQAKTLGDDDRPETWDRMAEAGVDWFQTDLAEEVLGRMALRAIGPRRVKIAHRRGAARYAPENTSPAIEKAIRLGADFVEFDVRTTSDAALVLLHDGNLDRTTSGQGRVRDSTLSEVRVLDAGSWFGRPFAGTQGAEPGRDPGGGRPACRTPYRRQGRRARDPCRDPDEIRVGRAGGRLSTGRLSRAAQDDRPDDPPGGPAPRPRSPRRAGRTGAPLRLRRAVVDPLQKN